MSTFALKKTFACCPHTHQQLHCQTKHPHQITCSSLKKTPLASSLAVFDRDSRVQPVCIHSQGTPTARRIEMLTFSKVLDQQTGEHEAPFPVSAAVSPMDSQVAGVQPFLQQRHSSSAHCTLFRNAATIKYGPRPTPKDIDGATFLLRHVFSVSMTQLKYEFSVQAKHKCPAGEQCCVRTWHLRYGHLVQHMVG